MKRALGVNALEVKAPIVRDAKKRNETTSARARFLSQRNRNRASSKSDFAPPPNQERTSPSPPLPKIRKNSSPTSKTKHLQLPLHRHRHCQTKPPQSKPATNLSRRPSPFPSLCLNHSTASSPPLPTLISVPQSAKKVPHTFGKVRVERKRDSDPHEESRRIGRWSMGVLCKVWERENLWGRGGACGDG